MTPPKAFWRSFTTSLETQADWGGWWCRVWPPESIAQHTLAHSQEEAAPSACLASGILNTSRSWTPEDPNDVCVVSQFSLTDPWSDPRAMQRNSTIAALADRVLVAAAGTSGGSWEMAQLCLKRQKPLFVLDLATDAAAGNQKLIKAGATPVDPIDPSSLLEELGGPMTLFR